MRRGLTLLEVLIISFMLLLVMSMIGLTAAEYSRVSRRSVTVDSQLEVAGRGLSFLAGELQEAQRGLSPTSAALANLVEFERVRPDPARFAPPTPASFDPTQPRVTVTFTALREL